MRLKCFVACAFGHPEVDAIYVSMKKILSTVGVDAQRVDRISHNSKIDAKIIELIKKCDFGIADLTFARPSVYYEAGWIHGLGKEVLFTCRKDHFKGTEDHGKIHFDIITHNVLGWSSATKSFEKDFTSRVTQIIAPLKVERHKKTVVQQEEHQFDLLSRVQKLAAIRDHLSKLFAETRYYVADLGKYEETVLGIKTGRQKKDQLVFGFVAGSFTEKQIRDLQRYNVTRVVAAVNKGLAPAGEKLEIGDTTYIICSLASVRDATIQKALWHYSKFSYPVKMYTNETNGFWEKAVFIDNIKSITDLKTRVQSVLT